MRRSPVREPPELNFETTGSLEVVEQRLRAAQVTITHPATDGLLVKINQLEPDLYT